MDKAVWARGIDPEVRFWSEWLNSKGGRWPLDFISRTDPKLELQRHIANVLRDFKGERLKILDVGSGPLTYVGKMFRGRPIDLVACDALATYYEELNFPVGLPLVSTQACDAEMLSAKFGTDVFDLTYSRNALDHSYDPIQAFREMIAVTKPRGFILAEHAPNEAIAQDWGDFHQWNFAVEGAQFVIANKEEKFVLNTLLEDEVEFVAIEAGPLLKLVMRKKPNILAAI